MSGFQAQTEAAGVVALESRVFCIAETHQGRRRHARRPLCSRVLRCTLFYLLISIYSCSDLPRAVPCGVGCRGVRGLFAFMRGHAFDNYCDLSFDLTARWDRAMDRARRSRALYRNYRIVRPRGVCRGPCSRRARVSVWDSHGPTKS